MGHFLIKRIATLSLCGFILAILAVAFHYHDNTFFRASCSICKVKISVSETVSKNKVDSAPAVTVASLGLEAVYLLFAVLVPENTTIFIPYHLGYIWPNKAPPFRS